MDFQIEAAISKVFASEAAWNVTDEAIQVLGGNGFMTGNGLEKVMRDLRIFRIFEGTNDILRLFIALTGMQFAGAAAVLSQDTSMFGTSVEKALIKHGKEVINQQFLLNRIANAAIDIYVATCVISRCSSSLEQGLESAHYEQMMTKVWCSEAHVRIGKNLEMLKDPSSLSNFSFMTKISERVCSEVRPVQTNPLGF